MSYFVYILRTFSNTLHIGQTNNLEKRIKEHLVKKGGGAKYTRTFESIELVCKEYCQTRKEVIQREAQLKKWTKKSKKL